MVGVKDHMSTHHDPELDPPPGSYDAVYRAVEQTAAELLAELLAPLRWARAWVRRALGAMSVTNDVDPGILLVPPDKRRYPSAAHREADAASEGLDEIELCLLLSRRGYSADLARDLASWVFTDGRST